MHWGSAQKHHHSKKIKTGSLTQLEMQAYDWQTFSVANPYDGYCLPTVDLSLSVNFGFQAHHTHTAAVYYQVSDMTDPH